MRLALMKVVCVLRGVCWTVPSLLKEDVPGVGLSFETKLATQDLCLGLLLACVHVRV